MLSISNLSAQISPNFQLGPISFQAEIGQVIVILGENGSGKTSLFRTLLGETPANGKAILNDCNLLTANPQERAKQISIVPQIENVPFHFTVKEAVLMGCLPHNQTRWESDHEQSEADSALATLQIDHLRDRFLHELSGGERQKTLIARSIAQNPQLLLLDEPTAHVDLKTRANLKGLIPELSKNRISLVTTHDIAWGTSIADHCLVFQKGKIVASSNTKNLSLNQLAEIFSVEFEYKQTQAGRTFVRPAC